MAVHSTERDERLWIPVVAPVAWAVHFTLCYVTVSLACGRFTGTATVSARTLVAIYSVATVAVVAAMFGRGLRRHGYTMPREPNDDDVPESRQRFVGFTTMLLAGLSLIGTVYVWFAITLVDQCS